MKFLSLLVILMLSFTAHAGFEGLNQGVSLKLFNRLDCAEGLACSKVKDKFVVKATGVAQVQTQSTAAVTPLTSQACGTTIINAAAVVVTLPSPAANLGCRITFVTGNASNFDIEPGAGFQILVLTNAAGDSIRNATLGNSVTLEAISATEWAAVAINGTYTDID